MTFNCGGAVEGQSERPGLESCLYYGAAQLLSAFRFLKWKMGIKIASALGGEEKEIT